MGRFSLRQGIGVSFDQGQSLPTGRSLCNKVPRIVNGFGSAGADLDLCRPASRHVDWLAEFPVTDSATEIAPVRNKENKCELRKGL